MLAIRLKPELEQRLERLAKKTGRTKTYQYLTAPRSEFVETQHRSHYGKVA